MRFMKLLIGAVIFVFAASAAASAAIVNLEADITQVVDNSGFLDGSVAVGGKVNLTYSFDPATPDSSPTIDNVGRYLEYYNDGQLLSASFGNYDAAMTSGYYTIQLNLDRAVPNVGFFDDYSVTKTNVQSADLGTLYLQLMLSYRRDYLTDPPLFDSDALPAMIALADFNSTSLIIEATTSENFWYLVAEPTAIEVSAVPLPGAIWLLGAGLAGLVSFRKKGGC